MADVRDLSVELARLATDQHDFAEFFRSPSGSLSLTVARWPAGSTDDQQPHTEDEVYHVFAGRATLVIRDERAPVEPGSVAFVAAGADHRFVDITEDLEVLVFWSPARHTNAR
jgi:mannose-6-phosphate isomerase-like protein (cupin superfamily)